MEQNSDGCNDRHHMYSEPSFGIFGIPRWIGYKNDNTKVDRL